jgi:hypothetical protein
VKGDFLYDFVDFILNQATENELEVIRAALKRRVEGNRIRGPMGIDPARLARESASRVREQFGLSMGRIRAMVKDLAADILRKNAPELTEKQLGELLDAWVPEDEASGAGPGARPAASNVPGSGASRRLPAQGGLPPEALVAMIARFISFGTQTMSISEQIALQNETPDWQKRYWEQFSPRVRRLVSLYLNGQLDKPVFWERTKAELGLEPSPPSDATS